MDARDTRSSHDSRGSDEQFSARDQILERDRTSVHDRGNEDTPEERHQSGGSRAAKLTLLTLVLSLLLLLAAGFVQNRMESAVRREVGTLLSTVLFSTHENMMSWYRWRANDARTAVASEGVLGTVQALLKAHVRSEDLITAPAQRALRAKMRPFMVNKGYLGYFVISPDGINLASSRDANIGVRSLLNEDPDFLLTIFSGHSAISRPQISDVPLPGADGRLTNASPTVFVGVPVFAKNGDHVIAAFTFRINTLSDFSAIFTSWRLGKSGEVYAVSANGQMLSESRFDAQLRALGLLASEIPSMLHVYARDPGGDMTRGYVPDKPRAQQPLTKIVRGIAAGVSPQKVEVYRDYRGVDVLGVRMWIPEFNFGIVAKVDVDEALSTLYAQRYMVWGVIVLAIGLMVVLAVFVHRSRTYNEAQAMHTQAILENAVDGILTVDYRGVVRSFNPAAERIFGYQSGEIVGRKISTLLGDEENRGGEANVQKYFAERRGGSAAGWRVIFGKRKNGTEFPMDMAIRKIWVGENVLFLGTVRDITERRRAEDVLRQSEERLRNAQRIAHLGSWSWDFTREEMIWSDEIFRIFGLRPKEIRPTFSRLMDMVHPQDRDRVEALLQRSWEDQKGFHVEHRISLPNGVLRSVQQIGEIVRDAGGEAVRMDATMHDITERKQAEMAKSEFVATVSHELRTPMTSIHGSLGLLLGGAAGVLAPKKKELIQLAHNSSERLIRLINDILDFEKLEAGSMPFNMIEYSLIELVEQAVQANVAYAERFQVTLELLPFTGEAFVLVDIDRFAQVMTNLLSNAIKFSPPGARIKISVQVRGKNVRVSVIDQGPGIPEEFRGKIFQKFTQADSSDTRTKGGTGLGLSITRSIVNNMHGVLSFETHLGRGTTFYFDLPLMHRSRLPVGGKERFYDPPRVLVCAHDHDDAAVLKSAVLAAGGQADIARSYDRAEQLYDTNGYAAVIVDVASSEFGGGRFLYRVVEGKERNAWPAVIVSAGPIDESEGAPRGIFGTLEWLEEQFDFMEMKYTVKEILGGEEGADALYVETGEENTHVISQVIDSGVGLLRARGIEEAKTLVSRKKVSLILFDATGREALPGDVLDIAERPNGEIMPILVFMQGLDAKEREQRVAAMVLKSETVDEEFTIKINDIINRISV